MIRTFRSCWAGCRHSHWRCGTNHKPFVLIKRALASDHTSIAAPSRKSSCFCVCDMSASSTGANVNAIVKLLSEKSASDVRQGFKLLRDFLHEHGSSGRSELLQWGVVHSIMTLLTEACASLSLTLNPSLTLHPLQYQDVSQSFLIDFAGVQRSPQDRRVAMCRTSLFKPQFASTSHRPLCRDCVPVAAF